MVANRSEVSPDERNNQNHFCRLLRGTQDGVIAEPRASRAEDLCGVRNARLAEYEKLVRVTYEYPWNNGTSVAAAVPCSASVLRTALMNIPGDDGSKDCHSIVMEQT